jgi:hypothetical protein
MLVKHKDQRNTTDNKYNFSCELNEFLKITRVWRSMIIRPVARKELLVYWNI